MLRVTQPFAAYVVGDAITDAKTIKAILASDNATFVVAAADEEPADKTDTPTD